MLIGVTQWRSTTFGRSGRSSNLPPFRLRFCVTSCYLRKERTNIWYIMAPTQNWRRPNTNKVEPDAAKDPMLLPRILRIDYALQLQCFVFIARKHIWNYNLIFTWIFKNNFRPYAAPSKCRPVRPALPASPRYASAAVTIWGKQTYRPI